MKQTARALSLAIAVMLSASAPARQTAPPPPPPEYDPVPGPFFVAVDRTGVMTDAGVLDTAIANWAGPRLSAFTLCVQPGDGGLDPAGTWHALSQVAQGLTARGAAIVVIEAGHLCRNPPVASLPSGRHVEVRGVIRAPR